MRHRDYLMNHDADYYKKKEEQRISQIKLERQQREKEAEEELNKIKIQQTLDIMGRVFKGTTRCKNEVIYLSDGGRYIDYDELNLQRLIAAAADVVYKVYEHYGQKDSATDLQEKLDSAKKQIDTLEVELEESHKQHTETAALKDKAILELSAYETKVQGVVDAAKHAERLKKNVVVGSIKDQIEHTASKARTGVKKQSQDFIDKIIEIVNHEYQQL